MTRCGSIGIIVALECAARPSGCSKPGTLTRQSLVPGYFYFSPKNCRFLNKFIAGSLSLFALRRIHLVRNKNVSKFRSSELIFHLLILLYSRVNYSDSNDTLSALMTLCSRFWGTPLTSNSMPGAISSLFISSNSVPISSLVINH